MNSTPHTTMSPRKRAKTKTKNTNPSRSITPKVTNEENNTENGEQSLYDSHELTVIF